VDWLRAMVEERKTSTKKNVQPDEVTRMIIIVNLQPSKANIHIIKYFGHRMKKWLSGFGILFLLVLAAVYIFIPSTLNIVVVMPVKCNVEGADRTLRDTVNRAKWWPDDGTGAIGCRVTGIFRRGIELMIDDGRISVPSRLSVYPKVMIDSCLLQWDVSLSSGLNPMKRIERYRRAEKLATDMKEMLSRLGSRLEDQRLVYGMEITQGNTSTDSVLVSTEKIFDLYPSDSAVYVLVEKLRRFVVRNGGHETGHPMLNVTNQLLGAFKVEVGLPTDKFMKGDGDIRWKRLVRVQFLEADVRGGDSTVREAMRQMANYISDYQRTVMAIPYQSLITDRMKEPDTTKWMTRLYVPIYPQFKDH
jgi:hypothetical protein